MTGRRDPAVGAAAPGDALAERARVATVVGWIILAAGVLSIAAMRAEAAKSTLPVTVDAPDDLPPFPQEVEAAVYFCILEAIQNAAKYADATRITVTLTQTDGLLTFQVLDDGRGFDPQTTPRGHGLTNITDRLDALGGKAKTTSSTGKGTSVSGVLPLAIVAGHEVR